MKWTYTEFSTSYIRRSIWMFAFQPFFFVFPFTLYVRRLDPHHKKISLHPDFYYFYSPILCLVHCWYNPSFGHLSGRLLCLDSMTFYTEPEECYVLWKKKNSFESSSHNNNTKWHHFSRGFESFLGWVFRLLLLSFLCWLWSGWGDVLDPIQDTSLRTETIVCHNFCRVAKGHKTTVKKPHIDRKSCVSVRKSVSLFSFTPSHQKRASSTIFHLFHLTRHHLIEMMRFSPTLCDAVFIHRHTHTREVVRLWKEKEEEKKGGI